MSWTPTNGATFRTPAPHGLLLRVRVAVKRDALNRQLAEGTPPPATPALSLRATQLISRRSRKRLARTLVGCISEARYPPPARARAVVVSRRAVLNAEDALRALIERLRSPQPVRPQGMAITERIITDGIGSPLYNEERPGELRRLVMAAIAAMGPATADSHEFPLAA